MAKKQISATPGAPLSRKQALREARRARQRRQRMIVIGMILGGALLVIAAISISYIREATAPVGEFVRITPGVYPNAKGTTMGNPDAPVKIEVFEDFQCHACQNYNQNVEPLIIEQLVKTNKVYYVFHHYPFLDDQAATKESDQAANASMCAAHQDRFWDYKQLLFANMTNTIGQFRDKLLLAFAESLGLDMNDFQQCFEENRYKDQIQADITLARQMRVTGTPSVFVNGKQITPGYVPTFEQILQAVEEALAASGG